MRNSRHVSFLVPFVSINEQLRRGPEGLFWRNPCCQRYRRDKREKLAKEKSGNPNPITMREGFSLRTRYLFSFVFWRSQIAVGRIVPGLPWISISLIVLLTLGLPHLQPWSFRLRMGGLQDSLLDVYLTTGYFKVSLSHKWCFWAARGMEHLFSAKRSYYLGKVLQEFITLTVYVEPWVIQPLWHPRAIFSIILVCLGWAWPKDQIVGVESWDLYTGCARS